MITNEQEEVIELEDGQEFATLGEETSEEVVEEEEVAEVPSYQIPEKFKDKSIEDVAKSYQELESEFGRRNNEVGELRKLTDELLQLQLKEKKEVEAPKEVDVDSLLENPTEAINSAVNARFKALEDQLTEVDRNKGKVEFEKHHPDSQVLLQDPAFNEWVGSSQMLTKMFQEAHVNYDYAAADELFSMYKQLHGSAKEEAQEKVSKKRSNKLKAAKTETGSTGATSTKIYRRADLVNLKLRDPARYEAMEDEIMLAYAEKRVK